MEETIFSKTKITLHECIEAIITVMNVRDPYTFEHSWRVAEISEFIADNLGLDETYRERIHIAAHLHDIGKVAVPNRILNKEDKLTEDEYRQMKDHSTTGYQIVKRIPKLERVALYVKHHHERFDGYGYPDGISGTDIPLGARIIAVADSYDALTSTRPYRLPIPHHKAIKEIESVSGTQLCPEVSTAFLHMESKIPAIVKRAEDEILKYGLNQVDDKN